MRQVQLLGLLLTGAIYTASAAQAGSTQAAASSSGAITVGATISGKAFYDQNHKRLLFRGVGFQPVNGVDPLIDVGGKPNPVIQALLQPSNKYSFKNLNINALRVYQVSHNKPHAKTMSLLAQNGIYVIVGLANDPYGTNIPQLPGNGQHPYPSQFKVRVQQIIDEFQAYPNVLSFEVANEVTDPGAEGIGTQTQLNAASAIKAAANDAQTYMTTKKYRAIPVGVAMQDTPDNESTVAQYYASSACNGQPLDYIGINTYRYVPPAGNATAYEGLVSDYQIGNYSIPVILSEYEAGLTSGNRDFLDVPSFYNDSTVSGNISGGFAYQYIGDGSGAGSGYALVKLGKGSTGLKSKTDVKNLKPAWPNNAFANLATQYQTMLTSATPTTASPGSLACPGSFNPPLCVVGSSNCGGTPPSTIAISVQANQTTQYPMAVVQGGNQIVPPSPINDGNVHSVAVDPTQQLLLQQTVTWYTICTVAANTLAANSAVTVPAARWGGACTVTPGQ
ncbi:MAG TPA: hypothetical protein VIF86_01465 [Methylobacter sp.]